MIIFIYDKVETNLNLVR